MRQEGIVEDSFQVKLQINNRDKNKEKEQAGDKTNQSGSTELWKKRMEHLAKLGESVESASRRRFMILQRANVSS